MPRASSSKAASQVADRRRSVRAVGSRKGKAKAIEVSSSDSERDESRAAELELVRREIRRLRAQERLLQSMQANLVAREAKLTRQM
jgi:hypothetical protein